MLQRYQLFRACLLGLAFGWVTTGAWAQSTPPPPPTSRVTPEQLTPPPKTTTPDITLPESNANAAPEGAAALWVTPQTVDVTGGLPQLGATTAALVAKVEGKRVTVRDLYDLANEIEAAYARAGYILARVTVPPQQLSDGGRFQIVIVQGFIEAIDLSAIPRQIRHAVLRHVRPLKDVPGLTLKRLERRLLLADALAGVQLHSALARGEQAGGTKLILSADWRPISINIGFDNRIGGEFGNGQYNFNLAANGLAGLGEQIYASIVTGNDFNRFFHNAPHRRILAIGSVVPLGTQGLTLNPEFTHADTTPITGANSLATEGAFERYSLRLMYPIHKSRRQAINIIGTFDVINEHQSAPTFAVRLNDDRLRLFSLGLSWSRQLTAKTGLASHLVLSQGIDGLEARNQAEATVSRVPLSRQGSRPDYTSLAGDWRVQYDGPAQFSANLMARGQYALSGALPSNGQFGLDGPEGLSIFTTGSLNVDSGLSLRGEVQRTILRKPGKLNLLAAPYIFGALAIGSLADPTRVEQRNIRAAAFGAGLRATLQHQNNGPYLQLNIEGGRGETNVIGRADTRVTLGLSLHY